MYGYYQPQQQQKFTVLKGRPVSSLEEARAIAIDFDGSVFYFPDMANNRIYTKQINLDGTASLNMYELKELPKEMPVLGSEEFVTRNEFNETFKKIQELLEKKEEEPHPGKIKKIEF